MSCPTCGGSERRQLADGFWECTSRIPGEEIAHPAGQPGPIPIPVLRPCGTRYHEGKAGHGAACACGISSIGRCKECDRPVCGFHGQLLDDAFLCAECREAEQHARKRQAEDAAAAARLERLRVRAEAESRVRAAARAAAARLRQSALAPTLPLTTPKLRYKVRTNMNGSERVEWFDAGPDLGRGWLALRIGRKGWKWDMEYRAEATYFVSIVLSDAGTLYHAWRTEPFRPGRGLRQALAKPLLGVEHECGLDVWNLAALGQLEHGLRQLDGGAAPCLAVPPPPGATPGEGELDEEAYEEKQRRR